MPERFDIAIVGGGPGGYVAALRAAQLGARAAIVERDRVGGTCLLRGCIPTKALLSSSELYTMAGRGAEFGVLVKGLSFDLAAAQRRKNEVVEKLVSGVEGLLKAAGVEVLKGAGRLGRPGEVAVGRRRIEAADVILATGSEPAPIPLQGVELTLDSDRILELDEVPRRLVVVGGGVVGMEFAALYSALGSEVTVLEMLPQILPMVESDIAQAYRRHFEKAGGKVVTEAAVAKVSRSDRSGLRVGYSAGGESEEAAADVVLLAAGRRPVTDHLGLEEAGVELEGGRVRVDDRLRTAADHVWAVGDVIGGVMLAHVASYEGVCAVESIAGGRDRRPDYHAVPNCIYTDPEIANVGLGERAAREAGYDVRVGRFPLQASGRALTLGLGEGMVKVVTDAGTDRVLGVQMVGPRVTDLVAEATLAVQQNLTAGQIELTMHAHPTMAESLLEATLAADGRAIHIANRPRVAAASASGRPGAASRVPGPAQELDRAPAGRDQEEDSSVAGSTPAKPARPPAAAPPGGAAVEVDAEKIAIDRKNRGKLLELHHLMVLIRRFEEQASLQYTRAKIGGYCHLNVGEEATVVGGILALRAGDYIYTSYREHGHAIARGVDPKAVMAELFGRETGVAHGRGGSMHIFDYSHRFMGGYGIVGGHLPLAAGAAFSIKYKDRVMGAGTGAKGSGDIVFCMFGDGATNNGSFHESLNFAKVMDLPVVWFCVNNQYGMGTAVGRASAVAEIHTRACAYDMESIRVDGMDLIEVLKKTAEVVEKTRQDSQPRFIEAVCYRFKGHSVVDPDKYRSEEEKERWLKSDPLLFFEHQLEKAKVAGPKDFGSIRSQVEAEVERIVQFADESPEPAVEDLHRYVYAGEWEEAAPAGSSDGRRRG
ncbi:MAG: dihydrolipoyl dehydrogenase [Candidatus Dormibacteraceae bacterium]